MKNQRNENGRQRALDGLLREVARCHDSTGSDFVTQVMADVQSASKTRKVYKWSCIAAVVIIGLILGSLVPTGDQDVGRGDAVASLRVLSGEATLMRDGRIYKPGPGEMIYPGDRLDSTGYVVVDYPDRSMVELYEGCCLFSWTKKKGKGLELKSGSALCSMVKQDAGKPMAFTTPHGRGEVINTVFEMSVRGKVTQVKALRGHLQIWDRSEEFGAREVGAGQVAVVNETDIQIKDVDSSTLLPGGILWAQEFGKEYGDEADIEGDVTELVERGRRISAIRSRKVHPLEVDNEWYPEQWLSIELKSRESIFVLPPDWEIVFRIKAKNVGTLRVALTPEDPWFEAENVISEELGVDTGWVDITLREADFFPYKASRKPRAGMKVRSLTLWSFDGADELILDRILVRRGQPHGE